jgi:ribonuclease J
MSEEQTLRVIPIGGLGEIGMNLMVYEFGGAAIVVDCGMMFPDAATLGVDVVIPDMSYLFDNAEKFVGIFLTHGHEDHIGATPFLAERVNVPIYGTPLTLGFVRDKLEEFGGPEVELRTLKPRDVVEVGPFTVEAIRVTHSIVDALALAIRTPIGTIIHTGDFKLDQTPIDGQPSDLARLAAYGEEGVLLLASDSTGAVEEGYTRSERTVGNAFRRIFAQAPSRIIITTFASHIHRVQQVVDLGREYGRKVHFVGRSLVDNVETAERLGYLRVPKEVRAGNEDLDDKKAVIVTTGAQGEPTSALTKMALNEHRFVHLRPRDTVVISARTIPGNERAVAHVVDHLYRRGADVIYHEVPDVHVSGHASADELRLMMNLTRPRYFIPMHGTVRHMVLHGRIAQSVGIPEDRTFVVTNGAVVEIGAESGRVLEEQVPSGKVFIDHQYEEVSGVVVRDRKHLAEDGFVILVVALNMNSGETVREPEIITRGLVHVDANQDMIAELRELVLKTLAENRSDGITDKEAVQEKLRAVTKRYFRKKLERRPMILPVVWEM